MITVQTFSVDEVDYEVKLVGGTSIVFKATMENPDADGTWWDDDLTYSTIDIVGGTKRPLKVYGELAKYVRTIIHGNKLKYCHFLVSDERRALFMSALPRQSKATPTIVSTISSTYLRKTNLAAASLLEPANDVWF